jgi:hypothetical protein
LLPTDIYASDDKKSNDKKNDCNVIIKDKMFKDLWFVICDLQIKLNSIQTQLDDIKAKNENHDDEHDDEHDKKHDSCQNIPHGRPFRDLWVFVCSLSDKIDNIPAGPQGPPGPPGPASQDTLAGLSCLPGQIAKFDGSNWVCGADNVGGGGGTGTSDVNCPSVPNVDASGIITPFLDLRGCNLQGSDFSNSEIKYVNFEGADLRGANFDSAKLNSANFKNTLLDNADFLGAILIGADFSGSNLQSATGGPFVGCIGHTSCS